MRSARRQLLAAALLIAACSAPDAVLADNLNWFVLPAKSAVNGNDASASGESAAAGSRAEESIPGGTATDESVAGRKVASANAATATDKSSNTSAPLSPDTGNVEVEPEASPEPLIPPVAEPVELHPHAAEPGIVALEPLADAAPEVPQYTRSGEFAADIDPSAGSVHEDYAASGEVIDSNASTPINPPADAALPVSQASDTGDSELLEIEQQEEEAFVRSLLEEEAATADPLREDAEATTEVPEQDAETPEPSIAQESNTGQGIAVSTPGSDEAPSALPEDDDPESVQEPLPAASAANEVGAVEVAEESVAAIAEAITDETIQEPADETNVQTTGGDAATVATDTIAATERPSADAPSAAVENIETAAIDASAHETSAIEVPETEVPEFTVGDWMLSNSTPGELELPQAEDVALIPQPPVHDGVGVIVNAPSVDVPVETPVELPAEPAAVAEAAAPDEAVERVEPVVGPAVSPEKSLAFGTSEDYSTDESPAAAAIEADTKKSAPATPGDEPQFAAAGSPLTATGESAGEEDAASGPTSNEMAALEAELEESLELGPVAMADGIEPADPESKDETAAGDRQTAPVTSHEVVDQIINANMDEIDAANSDAAALPPPMTLVDILERALANNPEVGMALAREEQARWAVKEAGAYRSPTLDLVVEAGPEYNRPATKTSDIEDITPGRNLNLRLTKLLYDGGTSVSEEKRRQQIRRTTEIETRLVIEEIVVKAVKAYMQILQNQQAARVADDFVAEMKRMVDQISVMKESGAASKIELDFAKSRLASATAQTGTTEAQLNDAIASLEFLTGDLPPFTAVTPMKAGEIQVDTLVNYADRARNNNAEVLLNASNKTALGLKLRGQMAAYKPILTLNMKSEALADEGGNLEPRNTTEAKLKVEYFIIDGGVRKARIQRTKAQLVELDWDHERVVKDVDRRIKQSYNQITTNRLTLSATEDEISANEELRRLNRKNLEIGEISILELIEVEERLFNSRANRDRIAAEMLRNYYELLIGTGDLPQVLSEDYLVSRVEPLED